MKYKNETLGVEAVILTDDDIDVSNIVSGGLPMNPTWDEYIDMFRDEHKKYYILLKDAVTEWDWIGKTGGEICNEYSFLFSDGVLLSFTWRAWGDFMQSVIGKKEGYMEYYM